MLEKTVDASTDYLAPETLVHGADLLQQGKDALRSGDGATLQAVEAAIITDPSLGPAVQERMAQENKQDKLEAQQRTSVVVNEIKDLYKELVRAAIANRNPGGTHDSIGEKNEQNLKAIVDQVTQLLETGAPEDLEKAIQTLNADAFIADITVRISHLVRYFQGEMPDALRPQARILDRIRSANEGLKTANSDWQKLKNQQ